MELNSMKKQASTKISVIGDGGWGTTLAIHLANKNYPVTLWGPFAPYLQQIRKDRLNPKFLPGIHVPETVTMEENLSKAINESDLIVFAIPSKYAADVLKDIKKTKVSLKNKTILSVTKGIDNETLLRMSEIIRKILGSVPTAVLSGPTIAMEVAKGIPSTAVIACKNHSTAKNLQTIVNSDRFRIYTNTDVAGVEVGGSIKNIIALACGVCDGLGFGTNTKSALLTRGLAEMARLGKAMGAKQKTFFGLSGLGDLATTCFNPQSRNRTVGEALGQGKTIDQILSSMDMVAEGVETVKPVHKLSQKLKIPMPISNEVYKIIYEGKKPSNALTDLMTRKMKAE